MNADTATSHVVHATVPAAPPVADITSRSDLETLMQEFYRDVATDDLLGPIFEAAQVHWLGHIETLSSFWAWQLLGERGYEGNPLLAHVPLHQQNPFTDAHFSRWLDLFTTTVDIHFVGPVAEAAKQRAAKMANAMQRLLDGQSSPADRPITPQLTSRP